MENKTTASVQEKEICQDCGIEVTSELESQHVRGLCDSCERARIDLYPELLRHLKGIVEMTHSVADNWESGDLAAAVRNLDRIATSAETALAKAPVGGQTEAYERTAPADRDDKPWTAEQDENGFYRVVNNLSVVLAQGCVKEEAQLFAAAPELADALEQLLQQTVDMDQNSGIELTEGEREARDQAIAALAKAYGTRT